MSKGVPFYPRRPFGTVNPPTNGAHFEQRGRDGYTRLYGVSPDYPRVIWPGAEGGGGQLIGDDIKASASTRKKPASRKAATSRRGRKPAARKAAEEKPTGRFAKMKKGEEYEISRDDLAAWGRGEAEIDFAPDLIGAFEHHFDRTPADEADAGLILVEENVLEQGELVDEAPVDEAPVEGE